MKTKIDADDRKHTIFMASIVFSMLFLLILASPARAQGVSSFIAESSLIDLVIEKQDYIEKYLSFNFTRINSTAWNMSWAFNETVRQMISNCRANSQCNYQQLKNQLIPEYDIPLGSFISDVALLDRMPVQALNDAKAHVIELNYLNTGGSFVAEFTAPGQKIKIGQRSVLITAIVFNVRDDSISYNSSGAFFATSLSTSGSGQIHKSTNNGSTWSLVSSGIGSTPIRSYIDSNNLLQIVVGSYHYSFNTSNSTLSPAHLLPSACRASTFWYPIPRRNGNISFIGQTAAGNALSLCEMNGSGGMINFIFQFNDNTSGGNQFAATETPDGFLHIFKNGHTTLANWNYTNVSKTYAQSTTINLLTNRRLSDNSAISSSNGTVYATVAEIMPSSSRVLWFTRMDNNTKAFSQPKVIANYSDVSVSEAELVLDAATGNLFVLFDAFTGTPPGNTCYIINSTDGGNTWSPRISLTSESCFRPEPAGRFAWVNGLNSTKRPYLDFVFYTPSSNLKYENIPIQPPNVAIIDVIPVQVVRNVDLVKGKTTLVRVNVTLSASSSPHAVTVKIFFDGQLKNSTTKIMGSNTEEKFNLFFAPNETGTHNITATAEIDGQVMSSMVKSANVVETISEFDIVYVPVSTETPISIQKAVNNASDFLQKIYPLADNALNAKTKDSAVEDSKNTDSNRRIIETLQKVYEASVIDSGLPDRAIGIVPEFWIQNLLGNSKVGVSLLNYYPAILHESSVSSIPYKNGVAHELGHTYSLCDEYNSTEWEKQRANLGICPNGDLDKNGSLDIICITNPVGEGCPTSSFEPLTNQSDSQQLANFMGASTTGNKSWIDNVTYNYLLSKFSPENFTIEQTRILIRGVIFIDIGKGLGYEIKDFFTLGSGPVTNTLNSAGNFSVLVKNMTGSIVQSFNFEPSFTLVFNDGNMTNINYTPFSFVLPYDENISQFIFNGTNITQQTRNVTPNKPNITILSPNNFTVFSNELFNITWNASDLDGDNLSYIVQVSPNNGTNYTTFALDYNETTFTMNSSLLTDSKNYRVRVLVSDGVNTNNATINSTFEIDNDMNVTKFDVMYSNETQKIFRMDINNTLNVPIYNLSWILDTDETIKQSTIQVSLQPSEQIFFYIYHNYTNNGNYNVTFSIFNDYYLESDKIQISV